MFIHVSKCKNDKKKFKIKTGWWGDLSSRALP
jgi:hypothetical protein